MAISEYFVSSYSQAWSSVSPQISSMNSKAESLSPCRNKYQVQICIPARVISSVIFTMILCFRQSLNRQNCVEVIYITFKKLEPVEIS